MRKYLFVLYALLTFGILCPDVVAQNRKRPPLPDWVFEKPERSNRTFYYHVERATGETETEARNNAYTQAFMQVALKLGIPLNTEDISEAVASGTNVKLLSQRFTIPMNVACYCSRPNDEFGGWTYWLLCQIPEVGYADNARFDDFNECFKHERYDQRQKDLAAKAEKQRQDSLRLVKSENGKALAASVFIPGAGQMVKRHYTEGALTLVGEVALLGAGVGTYFGAKQQTKIMNSYGIDYATYQSAQKAKPIYQGVSYTCFGLAVVLYGVNLWRAYTMEPKQRNYAFYPTIIPVENTTNSNYAFGLGATIKF
ncbi:MAG: hypothetical protein IJQ06_08565 [Paludibacteraceae bacterium]|nr:hypothetical protein [Paludibacteraceae bacterium]